MNPKLTQWIEDAKDKFEDQCRMKSAIESVHGLGAYDLDLAREPSAFRILTLATALQSALDVIENKNTALEYSNSLLRVFFTQHDEYGKPFLEDKTGKFVRSEEALASKPDLGGLENE